MIGYPKPAKGTAKRQRRRKYLSGLQAWRDAVWSARGVGPKGQEVAACGFCGLFVHRGVDGEADHIKPRSTHPELRTDPTNGRPVHWRCNRFLKDHPLERERAGKEPI